MNHVLRTIYNFLFARNRDKDRQLSLDREVIRQPLFWSLSLLLVLFLCWPLFKLTAWNEGALISIYCIVLYVTYAVIYLSPSWFLSRLALKVTVLPPLALRAFSIGAVGVTLLFLYTDAFIYKLYGFHINGYVLNLIFTPGGINSMGGSGKSTLYFGLIAAGLIFSPAIVYYAAYRREQKAELRHSREPLFKWRIAIIIFLLFTTGERITHGFANIKGWSQVLYSGETFPLYQPATFRHLAVKLGFSVNESKALSASIKGGGVNYPLAPLQVDPQKKPMNLVWLVSESWRWDMLDPEIMPATWAFAKKSQRFTNHFSGGNGTRMGMFSMFYSLYAPTWFKMLDAHRGPVILDAVKKQGYQWDMYTSADFTYPEFDVTIFSQVEPAHLHDDNTKPSWKDDRRNVGKMLDFIEHRDKSKPFMTFMFFESPHARYYFPPENAIRKPYLEELNYATMDLEKDMPLIFNRYVNANNHLDSQFARVFSYLEKNNLLENTIVIVTGDHGEEFMEHGRWGHTSTYHNEQIRVPLILSIPGKEAAQYSYMTSHLDIVPTIAPLLGVKNPVSEYSLGIPLFGKKRHEYIAVGSWNSLAVVDAKYKIYLPTAPSGLLQNQISHADDTPIGNNENYFSERKMQVVHVMEELGRFIQHEKTL